MKRTITTTIIITLSVLLGLALWSAGRGAKAKAASAAMSTTSSFKASTAQIDITPSNNGFPRMFLAGFASRTTDDSENGTYPGDPGLSARAIAFDDGSCGGNIKVLVTADILGFTRQMRQTILTEVASRYGLPARNLLLSATHTHNGPVLTDNLDPRVSYPGFSSDGIAGSADLVIVDNYTNWLQTALVNLIGTAINGLPAAPQVDLFYGAGTADIGLNRIGIDNEDNDVPVLAVRSVSNNSLMAVIFGYACHPVVAGIAASHSNYYHPDFPGLARASLETGNPGAMAFFIQGAAGDINPDPEDIYAQGNALATAVQNVLAGGAMQPVSGSILTEVRDVTLPLNMDPNDPTHQQLRAKYDNIRNITTDGYLDRHANQMIAQIDSNTLPVNENWPVAVWHFGTNNSLVLAALGGEVVSGYALALKSQFAGQLGNKLWVAAYSNEVPGYIPSNQVWDRPGYEAGWVFGPDGGPFVSSFGTSQMFYGWVAPLKRGDGTTPGVEEIVLANTTSLIENPPSQQTCNQPPVAQCQNVTVFVGAGGTASASINNGSYDPDSGDTITVTQSPAGPYPLGTTLVTLTVTDSQGKSGSCAATVTVRYNFSGFFQPVDNLPTVNVVNAGQSIPVKFSLSGNKGLNIFAAGYPLSQAIACNFSGGTSDIEETVTAGASSLSYDAMTDIYTYVWKTDKAWKNTCRQLVVKLNDGTTHVANFQFK
jgi:hypothetical protein